MQTDAILGYQIHHHLTELQIETPAYFPVLKEDRGTREISKLPQLTQHFENIMFVLGLNLANDSLKGTPRRLAKMYFKELFEGLDYSNFPMCSTHSNGYQYDEVICINGIDVKSVCEHHFQPFIGKATVAYIPKEKVLGLSKFNRVVRFFGRRPQVQERLTAQIAAALEYILETEDVAVIIRAEHMCVKMRGVEHMHSDTVTSRLTGRFRNVSTLRQELLGLTDIKLTHP